MNHHVGLPQSPDARQHRHDRMYRPLAAGGALLAAGSIAVGAARNSDTLSEWFGTHEIGCATATVKNDGRYARGAVERAIDDLQDMHPDFDPVSASETLAAAGRVGPVNLGDTILVCGTSDRLMGDSVSAEKIDD